MKRITAHFSGQVQGVGFRYVTLDAARSFEVTGYVRNLPDGRVELVAEGEPAALSGLLEAVKSEMVRYIRNVDVSESPARGEYSTFSIAH
jgi:acylphosphatase